MNQLRADTKVGKCVRDHILYPNSDGYYVTIQQGTSPNGRYLVYIEELNGTNRFRFATRNDALEFIKDQFKNNIYISEHDEKLYNHVLWDEDRTYDENAILFEKYDNTKPTTLADLYEYVMNSNTLTTFWNDRNPVSFKFIELK